MGHNTLTAKVKLFWFSTLEVGTMYVIETSLLYGRRSMSRSHAVTLLVWFCFMIYDDKFRLQYFETNRQQIDS